MRERHIFCLEYLCTLMTSSETTFGSATNLLGSDCRLRNLIKNTIQRKFAKNYYARKTYPNWWSDQIYIYHDFDHPKYNEFVAEKEQMLHEDLIKLK